MRALNTRALPAAAAAAARAAGRDVSLGRVRWLSPLGLTGLAPLASVGPVAVGPGAGERSSAVADEVLLSLDAARSLAQLRLVLTVRGVRASVDVVQGPNLSWFGFPDDVVDGPSARDFLPGLAVEGGGEARDADVPLDARPSLADRPAPPESAQHFQPAVGADLPLVRKVPPAKPVRPTHKPPGGAETDAAAASSTAVPHAAAPSAQQRQHVVEVAEDQLAPFGVTDGTADEIGRRPVGRAEHVVHDPHIGGVGPGLVVHCVAFR